MSLATSAAPLITVEPRHVVLPPQDRIYALSDIHGFSGVMRQSLDIVSRDLDKNPPVSGQEVHLVMGGDVNDKGADTRKCIDRFLNYPDAHKKTALIGNHENYLINFINGPRAGEINNWINGCISWIGYGGGLATLKSYGVASERLQGFISLRNSIVPAGQETCGHDLRSALFHQRDEIFYRARDKLIDVLRQSGHLGFLKSLKTTVSVQHFVICHARINPIKPVDSHEVDEVIRGRDIFYYNGSFVNGVVVVYGHCDGKRKSPSDPPRLKPNSIGVEPRARATGKAFVLSLEQEGIVRFLTEGQEEVCRNYQRMSKTERYDAGLGAPLPPAIYSGSRPSLNAQVSNAP